MLLCECCIYKELSEWFFSFEVRNARTLLAKAQPGGAEGAQAPPLAIRILMFIFLVIHQHCKSRLGVLQNVLRQYHKA